MTMPLVILRTGFKDEDGCEETLEEYLCDRPDCANPAAHVVGVVRELGQAVVVCNEHVPRRVTSRPDDSTHM